jgi:hypothetical protein
MLATRGAAVDKTAATWSPCLSSSETNWDGSGYWQLCSQVRRLVDSQPGTERVQVARDAPVGFVILPAGNPSRTSFSQALLVWTVASKRLHPVQPVARAYLCPSVFGSAIRNACLVMGVCMNACLEPFWLLESAHTIQPAASCRGASQQCPP